MRNSFWLLGVAALMATLVSCNRNSKPEPAVYEIEVYKTQEILVNKEDRGSRNARRTYPLTFLDIDGKDVLVFSLNETNSYYDLATGKKMYGLDKEEDVELVKEEKVYTDDYHIYVKENDLNTLYLDTIMPPEVQLASSNEKLYVDTIFREKNDPRRTFTYDKTNEIYYFNIGYDFEYYGDYLHTCVLTDKDFNYLGEIYNGRGIWGSNGRLIINYEMYNDSIIKVNYLKLKKTDRNYKQYIDSCRADLEKRHNDWEEYKIKNDVEKSPIIALVKTKNEIDHDDYKVLTLYCNDDIPEAEKTIIDTLIANKDIFNMIPLYVIVSAENEDMAASFVKKNGLDCLDKIVFDTEGITKTEANSLSPRYIMVQDGLITDDIVYRNEEVGRKLIPRILGPSECMRYMIYYGELCCRTDMDLVYY